MNRDRGFDSFNRGLRRGTTVAIISAALTFSPQRILAESNPPEWIIVHCERLSEMRSDSRPNEYLPQRIGERLKRLRRVIVYGTPHDQEREFNQRIINRLGAESDAIVYIPENRYFRVESEENRCVLPPENPLEITDTRLLDGPPGGFQP